MTLTTSRQSHTVAHDIGLPSTGLGAFLLPSALCDLSDEVRHAARRLYSSSANARKDIALSATRICEWAHGALQYTPGATSTVTTAGQALERGAGVCQDYSHLMIAICRALAIPARYVAGYNPAEGLMHAWVEVLCEGLWHAWDPTHNGLASPHCVFVAGGRDFRDVEPLLGTYRGRSYAQLEVHCHTRVINIAHDGEAIHSLQGKKV